jgi:hypothetical protein
MPSDEELQVISMNHGKRTLVFPNVSGSNLEGKRFRLPNDFEGDLNIVIMAFKREHTDLIDSWLNSIAQMTEKNTGLRSYELPVLSVAYSPFRWWIDGGMRAGILDEEARNRTITVYTDKRNLKRRLEIPNEETIYIFLVNRNGTILWQDQGRFTEAKFRKLQNAVQEDLPI